MMPIHKLSSEAYELFCQAKCIKCKTIFWIEKEVIAGKNKRRGYNPYKFNKTWMICEISYEDYKMRELLK